MRRFLAWCGVAVVGSLLGSPPAGAQLDPQWPQAVEAAPRSVHHFSAVMLPSHHHHGGSQGWLFWGAGYPYWWIPAYTSPFPYYTNPFPSAPSVGFASPPSTPAGRALDQIRNDAPAQPSAKLKAKVTNAEGKAKAGRYIGFGDANFTKQKYLAAVERYRTAAEVAPDLAEPFFRQGFALVALGQFDSAMKAFRRGLRIRSDWTDSEFRLDQIYVADRLAKTTHLENLAQAVEANPFDSDLLIVLGMQLYFDGQQDRAGLFFTRAAQLGGNEDRLLNDFVPKPGPAGAAKAEHAAKVVF